MTDPTASCVLAAGEALANVPAARATSLTRFAPSGARRTVASPVAHAEIRDTSTRVAPSCQAMRRAAPAIANKATAPKAPETRVHRSRYAHRHVVREISLTTLRAFDLQERAAQDH